MNKSYLAAAKGEDLGDLLNHIAWTDTIRPALVREKEIYTKLLVEATLGRTPMVDTAKGPQEISKEQLAGRIYGIDHITDLFEKILTKGLRAIEDLRAHGVNVS